MNLQWCRRTQDRAPLGLGAQQDTRPVQCNVRMRTSRCAIANWKIRWVFAWEISIDWLIGCIKIKRNFPFSMRTKRDGEILPESGNTALQWTSRCPRVQDRRSHQIHNFWIYLIMIYIHIHICTKGLSPWYIICTRVFTWSQSFWWGDSTSLWVEIRERVQKDQSHFLTSCHP